MFIQSTASWIASVCTLIQLIQVWFLSPDPNVGAPSSYIPFFNALMTVNYILTDGVVVWRAWVLCSADGTKTLKVCLLVLCLGAGSVIFNIAIRVAIMLIEIKTKTGPSIDQLTVGINVTQIGTLVSSVLTNAIATSLISLKAWSEEEEGNTAHFRYYHRHSDKNRKNVCSTH
ncbi:hypothetical protein GYMLUDRAFT_251312 [Collybiopsis luxurians FD-317 M1]|uniref:Uncharacterized protein n=1 Tax=Collybiopsis luxurians FD-317 M1 TaxID=944289 RepID=A0A0D0BD12_9AGAR|nr:hypothetical protein GYMLUDRAFT_251312 [Collybiopsis luxurians FD-317 M1]